MAREVLPWPRVAVFAALTGSVGGALLVHDSVPFDFGTLRPQSLAVMLFVALPALCGAMIEALAERWLGRTGRAAVRRWWLLALGLVAVVLTVPLLAGSAFALAGAVLAVVLSSDSTLHS